MNNCQPFAPALTWTAEQYVFFTSTYSEWTNKWGKWNWLVYKL
jgi:hypothetical protein